MFLQLFSRLFSNTEVDNFARALASELAQRYPVGVEANDGEDGREGGRDEKRQDVWNVLWNRSTERPRTSGKGNA